MAFRPAATQTAELFQRVVFGRLLSVLPGGRGSASPNRRDAARLVVDSSHSCMMVAQVCWALAGLFWGCATRPPRRCHL